MFPRAVTPAAVLFGPVPLRAIILIGAMLAAAPAARASAARASAAGARRVPVASVPDPKGTFLAGMTLVVRAGRVVVGTVMPGSPAAGAGLLPGDALLVNNDQALIDLEPMPPQAVLALLEKAGPGDVRLVIGRGAGILGVRLPARPPDRPPGSPPASAAPEIGAAAPGFTAKDFHDNEVDLARFRGQPVLLDFWASWCPPCRDQAIILRRLAIQYPELVILGVSLDEDRREYEAFIYNNHLPGHQIWDGGPAGPIGQLYAVPSAGIPYSFLVSADGHIVKMGVSLLDKEEAIAGLAASSRGRSGTR